MIFRLSKTPAQILIRWCVQHGFITIPKTSQASRLQSNADVFNWSIPDEDMKVLVRITEIPYNSSFILYIGCSW
jgi:diketogulonate reductase-like aldo/keto reductase